MRHMNTLPFTAIKHAEYLPLVRTILLVNHDVNT